MCLVEHLVLLEVMCEYSPSLSVFVRYLDLFLIWWKACMTTGQPCVVLDEGTGWWEKLERKDPVLPDVSFPISASYFSFGPLLTHHP